MSPVTAVQYSRYGGPEVLEACRITTPRPGAGEVQIEVRAASVNPIDWKVRAGLLKNVLPARFPAITGRDGAGVIRAVGPEVDPARLGQRVCFLAPRGVGTWAGSIGLPASLAVPIPESMPFAAAAVLPLVGLSAWAAMVTTAGVREGMHVLVHAAAGGVGSMAVQIARSRGARVAATCSSRNAAFVRALGADTVVAYDQSAFETVLSDLDVVIDTIGGEVHRRSYEVLRRGGTIACLSAEPYEDHGAQHGVSVKMAQVIPDPAVLAELVALTCAGTITPAIEATLPFDAFAEAQRRSESGHARGKIVLIMP